MSKHTQPGQRYKFIYENGMKHVRKGNEFHQIFLQLNIFKIENNRFTCWLQAKI